MLAFFKLLSAPDINQEDGNRIRAGLHEPQEIRHAYDLAAWQGQVFLFASPFLNPGYCSPRSEGLRRPEETLRQANSATTRSSVLAKLNRREALDGNSAASWARWCPWPACRWHLVFSGVRLGHYPSTSWGRPNGAAVPRRSDGNVGMMAWVLMRGSGVNSAEDADAEGRSLANRAVKSSAALFPPPPLG